MPVGIPWKITMMQTVCTLSCNSKEYICWCADTASHIACIGYFVRIKAVLPIYRCCSLCKGGNRCHTRIRGPRYGVILCPLFFFKYTLFVWCSPLGPRQEVAGFKPAWHDWCNSGHAEKGPVHVFGSVWCLCSGSPCPGTKCVCMFSRCMHQSTAKLGQLPPHPKKASYLVTNMSRKLLCLPIRFSQATKGGIGIWSY